MTHLETSWRSGIGYDVIRSNREKVLHVQLLEICKREGAIALDGYPAFYVTPAGDVYSTTSRKLRKLRPGTKPGGYKFVGLSNAFGERKYEMVHRLVAKAFIPNPNGLPAVNHKDLDKSNNRVLNLEWVSHSENSIHAIRSGAVPIGPGVQILDEGVIAIIRSAQGSYRNLGNLYGCSAQTICNIKRGFTTRIMKSQQDTQP